MRKNTSVRSALSFAVAVFATLSTAFTQQGPNLITGQHTFSGITGDATPMVGEASGTDYLPSVCQQGEYQWQASKLPIKVFISNGTGTPGYRPQFASYIREGFNDWTSASGGKLRWKEVKDSGNADVKVEWTDNVTQRPNGTEAGETNAYTKLNPATGRGIIYGAHMSLLTELPNRQFSDLEMEKTCLHETGHALGLQGHSPNPTDIMYYAINARQQPALTERDRQTMADLYNDYSQGDLAAR